MRWCKKIGPHRYREQHGLYFEEFIVGDIYEHRPARTVTETDNLLHVALSMNMNPLHTDVEFAKQSEFGKILVSSQVTFALVNCMTVLILSANATANLGWDKVRLTHPVFIGDTLYAESTILATRLSKSRPQQGIITVETRGFNQHQKMVIIYERNFMIPTLPPEE
jgi:itaconyl-CoA hydratase